MADEFRRRLKLAMLKGMLTAKQTVRAKIVHQKDVCGLWFGRGECDCDPHITVTSPQDDKLPVMQMAPRYTVARDGSLERLV